MTLQHADVLLTPSAGEIAAAHARIAPHVRRTPLEPSPRLSGIAGCDVSLKLECWQPTRSFKVRGAFHALGRLGEDARARGVVAASAGNHGLAVALAARTFGIPARVFVPHTAPATKKSRIRALGAQLDESAPDYDETEVLAAAHARETGALLVHAFSDADVVAGAGTVALEILEDLPDVREVIVPVGGGGLIAGIHIVMAERKPAVRVIGVQSTETRVMHESLAAGRVVEMAVTPTLADGLAGCIDEASFARVCRLAPEMHLVDEAALPAAIRHLFTHEVVVAEGAGIVACAAVETLDLELTGPVAVIVSGGNIDATRLASILQDG